MKKLFSFLTLVFSCVSVVFSQNNMGHGHFTPDPHTPCLSEISHARITKEVQKSIAALKANGLLPHQPDRNSITLFEWPLAADNGLSDYGFHGISNFVDQNPNTPNLLLDYACGARTYDLASGYNHGGTDMYTWPFSWYKMDQDQVKVVAAADGIIVYKSDGNFDRNCGFNNDNWNAVYIQHADGSVAWYGHLKNGSVTSKNIGQPVTTGEYLGIVGSSGSSTGPHLHFEVYDAAGGLIDPYAGECNSLNTASWWSAQRPYFDSGLNALMTHDAPPEFPACPQTEILNDRNQFCGNELIYFAGYYRDQLSGQQAQYRVFRPDESIYQQWTQTFDVYYSSSYWYWFYTLPSNPPTGTWTFQIIYLGDTYTHYFDVIGITQLSPSGDTILCEGESVSLEAPMGYHGFQYQWERNGTPILGATNQTYEVFESGLYTCVISTEEGCERESQAVHVEVEPAPMIIIDPDELAFCEGESTTICAPPGMAAYLWNTGEVSECISTDQAGIYTLTVTTVQGCTYSTEVQIEVYPNPVVDLGEDVILLTGTDTILDVFDPNLTYEWSTGETTPVIFVTAEGYYSVTVTNQYGCTATDGVDILFPTSTEDEQQPGTIWIYPNPSQDVFYVYAPESVPKQFTCYDMTGRTLFHQVPESASAEGLYALSGTQLPSGLYVLEVKLDRQTVRKQLVRL